MWVWIFMLVGRRFLSFRTWLPSVVFSPFMFSLERMGSFTSYYGPRPEPLMNGMLLSASHYLENVGLLAGDEEFSSDLLVWFFSTVLQYFSSLWLFLCLSSRFVIRCMCFGLESVSSDHIRKVNAYIPQIIVLSDSVQNNSLLTPFVLNVIQMCRSGLNNLWFISSNLSDRQKFFNGFIFLLALHITVFSD